MAFRKLIVLTVALYSLFFSSTSSFAQENQTMIEASLFTMRIDIEAIGSEDAFGDDVNEYVLSPLFKSKERVPRAGSPYNLDYHLGSPAIFLIHADGSREKLYHNEPVDVPVGQKITLEFSILVTEYLKEQTRVYLDPTDKDPHVYWPFPMAAISQSDLLAFSQFDLNMDFAQPLTAHYDRTDGTVITYSANYSSLETYTLSELLAAQQELMYIQSDYTKNHFDQLAQVLRGNLLLHTE